MNSAFSRNSAIERPDIAEALAHLRRNMGHDPGSSVRRQGVEDAGCGPGSKSLDDTRGRAHTHGADDRPPVEGCDVLDLHQSGQFGSTDAGQLRRVSERCRP
jgi:hypothetical protein